MNSGVEFFVWRNQITIGARGLPKFCKFSVQSSTHFLFLPKKVYYFVAIDALSHLSFFVKDVESGEHIMCIAEVVENFETDANFVAFYNRERTGRHMLSYLSHLKIEKWNSVYKFQRATDLFSFHE
eukprot:TRINITY_DN4915_c0_g1_i3.p1 TRINITY_DN4915_c0_g1~~TRINITY_DN4915_c0_g1_i3.p1  ORF type:complete len:126 (-),score=25.10 TRINITY_DN4915_c0_g1_i3:20-397(-)